MYEYKTFVLVLEVDFGVRIIAGNYDTCISSLSGPTVYDGIFGRLKVWQVEGVDLRSFEHKAISPKSATLNIYQVCFLDGKNHFFSPVQSNIKPNQKFSPTLDFFSKDPHICPNSHEKLTKSEIR